MMTWEKGDRGKGAMKRGVIAILVLIVLSGYVLGCTGQVKDSKIRCPKCGAFFSTKEGVEEFERMRGYPSP